MRVTNKSAKYLSAMCFLLALATAVLLTAKSAQAQTGNATLRGTVTDPAGAVIPHADVTITNSAMGVARSITTNNSGEFSAVGLNPGTYSVHVAHSGFESAEVNGIVLNVGASDAIAIHLAVGAEKETVTVNGDNIPLMTTSPSVSTVVNQQEVQNMPLNGRSFQDLELLVPGTTTINPQLGTSQGHNSANGSSVEQIQVNGASGLSNMYIVDGVSMNIGAGNNGGFYGVVGGGGGGLPVSTILGNTQALVPVDDLQEFRVETSSYGAEYGDASGAQFIFQTRSGTNKFHGTASDYVRNTVFDANDYFNNYYGQPRQPLHQNDFSGALGGPVWIPHLYNGRNRSFFFFDYEGLRANFPLAATVQYGPTPALIDATTGPVHDWVASLPKPNTNIDLGDGLGEYISGYNSPSKFNTYNLRIDHTLSSKEVFFARASKTRSNLTSYYYGGTEVQAQDTRTYTAGLTSSFTPHVTNQLRANFGSNAGTQIGYQTPVPGTTPFNPIVAGGYPANIQNIVMFLGYYPSTGSIFAVDFSGVQENRQFEVNDGVSWLLGKHSLQFGADFVRLTGTLLPESPNVGYLWYSQQTLQANTPDYIYNNTDASIYPGNDYISIYGQDLWAINRRLTVSYGLRWSYYPSQEERRGGNPYAVINQANLAQTLPLTPGVTPAEAALLAQLALGPQKTPYSAGVSDFAPRVGATYLARSQPGFETQVRGGFGIYYTPVSNVAQPLAGMLGPGESGAATFCPYSYCTVGAQYSYPLPRQYLYTPISTPEPPYSETAAAIDPNLKDPYAIQTNVAVQQDLGKDNAVTLSYVGAFYRRNVTNSTIYVTPYNPNFTDVLFVTNGPNANTDYNSAQVVFERRMSKGLFAYAGYTWAHDIGVNQVNYLAPYVRGNTSSDLRNNLNLAVSWDIPYKSWDKLVEGLLGHWGIDVRFMARTGFPVSFYGQNVSSPASNGQQVTPGVNRVPNQPLYLYGTYNGKQIPGGKMFNPAAFVGAPLGESGTVAPNSNYGFGMNQWNIAIRRDFPIYDTLHLQFRADTFNILNQANFGAIDDYLPDVTFGQATSSLANAIAPGSTAAQYQSGGPRSMQLALKLVF